MCNGLNMDKMNIVKNVFESMKNSAYRFILESLFLQNLVESIEDLMCFLVLRVLFICSFIASWLVTMSAERSKRASSTSVSN